MGLASKYDLEKSNKSRKGMYHRLAKKWRDEILHTVHEGINDYIVEIEDDDRSAEELLLDEDDNRPKAHMAYGIGCIDDRKTEKFDFRSILRNITRKTEGILRPKSAGGDMVLTMLYELVTDPDADVSLIQTADNAQQRLEAKNKKRAIGYHTGFGMNNGKHTIDCAAIDRMEEILLFATCSNEQITGIVISYMKKCLGAKYDQKAADEAFKRLHSKVSGNDKLVDGYSGEKISYIAQRSDTLSSHVLDQHDAIGVMVSDIEYGVIKQQVLRDATKQKAGFFALNTWIMRKRASDLYKDELEDDKAFEDKVRFHAAVLYNVAAIFALTDGTLDWHVMSQAA